MAGRAREWPPRPRTAAARHASRINEGDIDLLVRVPHEHFEEARAIVDGLYARNPEQLSNELYQGYVLPSDLDVAVQLTVQGGPYDRFVAFLDALRASPALVERYNALKREWDGRPMAEYRRAKSALIEEVLAARRECSRSEPIMALRECSRSEPIM